MSCLTGQGRRRCYDAVMARPVSQAWLYATHPQVDAIPTDLAGGHLVVRYCQMVGDSVEEGNDVERLRQIVARSE
jgi:hypothetical protein